MKKQLYLAPTTVLFSLSSFAQRTIKFEVTLNSPVNGSTIAAGAHFDERLSLKTLAPGLLSHQIQSVMSIRQSLQTLISYGLDILKPLAIQYKSTELSLFQTPPKQDL